MFEWFAEFRRGRKSLDDEAHSGQPVDATTEENVAAVQRMLNEDARVTVAVGGDHRDLFGIHPHHPARKTWSKQGVCQVGTSSPHRGTESSSSGLVPQNAGKVSRRELKFGVESSQW